MQPLSGRGDPGGMGRFCKMTIFFLWAVARPGFSLLVCEMASRLKSVPHIRHLGSTILSRENFQEILRFFDSSKYPGRYGPWLGRYGPVSCFIFYSRF